MPEKERMLREVMIRRENRVVRGVHVKSLIHNIERNKLKGSDEISGDGEKWVRLDAHAQLGRYFLKSSHASQTASSSSITSEKDLAIHSVPLDQFSVDEKDPAPASYQYGMDEKLADLAEMLKELDG